MNRAATGFLVLFLWVGSACEGSGSDIGPTIEPSLPGADYRVLVQDDQGRGVSAAVVSVAGITGSAASGRSGRANLLSVPSGIRRITVDGADASATDTDELGTLTVSAATPDGNELAYVFNLPDVSQSGGLTLTTGMQGSDATLDDSATSGVILTVLGGSTVTMGSASSVTIRSGSLQGQHLPGDLPAPSSGALLVGQGAYVEPNAVTFSPGADLSLPNDLQLPDMDPVDFLFLDPTTGNWITLGTGTVSGARIVATGLVIQGGLYAFSTSIAQTGSVSGRVIDANGSPVPGVLVRAGEGRTRTAGSGSFLIADLAAELGDASPRTVTVEFASGRDLRPNSTTAVAGLVVGATTNLGDVTLDTFPVADVRLMLITRAAQDPVRRMGVGSSEGSTALLGIGDSRGQITLEDQRRGFFGWLTSRPRSTEFVFVSHGIAEIDGGQLTRDLRIFSAELEWWTDTGGGTILFVLDPKGPGPVRNAAVTRGFPPAIQFIGLTSESGFINLEVGAPGQVTGSISTSSGGRTFVTAYTVVDPQSGRVEMPLERANSLLSGSFDRHGLVSGNLLGGAAPDRVVTSTRLLERTDWYDRVIRGGNVGGDLPYKVDPAVTGGTAFTVGVAHPAGNLSAVEGTIAGGDFTFDRVGIEPGKVVPQGSRQPMDLSLSYLADTAFLAPHALNNLDSAIAIADLAFDLALVNGDTAVDLVQDVGGNMSFSGLDVTFTLPSLSGFASGSEYLVAFGGTNTSMGTTVEQKTVITLDGTPGPVVQFMDVPAIIFPAPGATVPSSGFTVSFTVPISTLYTIVDLRSETSTETRVWTAVLPASFTSFEFYTSPAGVANPLTPGTWVLTVTAARVENGPLFGFADSYKRMVSHFVGISAAERIVNAFSSSRITIATN